MPSVGEPKPAPQYPIESVDNALRVLLLFNDRRSIRLTDVSRYLDVASSTAHRLLAALQYRGFVRQNPDTREYEPGTALTSIASAVMRNTDIRALARPILERLSAQLGETVHIGRLEGTVVFFLDCVESPQAVRVGSRMGLSMPAHCTSIGKALLASLDPRELRALYPKEKLAGLTPHSITSRRALESDLDTVRACGFAVSHEESEAGVASVSVYVGRIASGRFAVNVSAPVVRMPGSVEADVAEALKRACDEISASLF